MRNVRDVLRLVLELARRSGAIKVNPVDGAKAPKKPPSEMVFLDASQIMTLADEVTNPPIRTGGGVNLPGSCGGSVPWEGWSYAKTWEIPGRAA